MCSYEKTKPEKEKTLKEIAIDIARRLDRIEKCLYNIEHPWEKKSLLQQANEKGNGY